MGTVDDYSDRTRKHASGAPVGPATNAVQLSIDMAAEAQRRAELAARSSGAAVSHQRVDHSVRELLFTLTVSVAVFALGLLSAIFVLPKDFIFIGILAALGGAIFALFAIFFLLKKTAGAGAECLFEALAGLFRRRR